MRTGDLLQRGVASILGMTTVVASVWLGASMFRGFAHNREVSM